MAYPGKFRLVLTGDDLNTIAGALHEQWVRMSGRDQESNADLLRLLQQFDDMLCASVESDDSAGWPVMVGGIQ